MGELHGGGQYLTFRVWMGREVLYAVEQNFAPPDAGGLAALNAGMTRPQSAPGGLALDFVREQIGGKPMITWAQMTPLPKEVVDRARAHALENAVLAAAGCGGRLMGRRDVRAWERVLG